MNDLKNFVVLQARLFGFLAQQDETTLQAIANGTVQLAVLPAEDAQAPVSSVPYEHERAVPHSAPSDVRTPSKDPIQVARDLLTLKSESDQRLYLNAAELPVKGLRKVARALGLTGYSQLNRPQLIDRLLGHTDKAKALAGGPRAAMPASTASPADSDSAVEQQAANDATSVAASSDQAPKPDVDVAAIAARLREIETEEEGAAYLHAQHLDRDGLLGVAAELQLTRVDRLRPADLEKRVLKQAIGDRRKFAGLRKW